MGIGIFPVLSLFFSLKSATSTPTKILFFLIGKIKGIISQRFGALSLKLRLWQEFENELLSGQIMPKDSLSNKRLPWKQSKRYLVHFTFSEGFTSAPNSLQNFKSLRVRVVEITGGLAQPLPQYKVWLPNISVWEELKWGFAQEFLTQLWSGQLFSDS